MSPKKETLSPSSTARGYRASVEKAAAEALARRLHKWFTENVGKEKAWGRVTMANLAHKLNVAYSTVNFWFLAAQGKEGGKLPKGLSIHAIREFLKS